MMKATFTTIVASALLFACGASQPQAEPPSSDAPCSPEECGPEPPIAPSACPGGGVSSVCKRGAKGTCEREIVCQGGAPTAAHEGETCGGAAIPPNTPVKCAEGLVCQNEAGDVTFPGKCVKK